MKRYGSGLYTTIHPELAEACRSRVLERMVDRKLEVMRAQGKTLGKLVNEYVDIRMEVEDE